VCSARVAGFAAKGLGGVGLVFGLVAIAMPDADRSAPARVNLGYHADVTRQQARHLLQAVRVPAAVDEVLAFGPNDEEFPWFGATQIAPFQAQADWLELPAPTVSLLRDAPSDHGRELELSVTPGESDALAIIVGVPAARLRAARIERAGIAPIVVGDVATFGMVSPAGPVRFIVELSGREPVPIRVVELHGGLPESSSDLQRARDITGTASQTGDVTAVSRDERY
jgi:hypothetical protein